jgi:hypothetical protein
LRSYEVGSQVHGESCAGASTGPVKCSQTSIWSHPTTRCRSPRCQRSPRHRRQMPRARRPNARQNRRRTLARPPLLQNASLQLRSHAAQVSRPAGPRFDMSGALALSRRNMLLTCAGCYLIWGTVPLIFQGIGRLGVTPFELVAQRITCELQHHRTCVRGPAWRVCEQVGLGDVDTLCARLSAAAPGPNRFTDS